MRTPAVFLTEPRTERECSCFMCALFRQREISAVETSPSEWITLEPKADPVSSETHLESAPGSSRHGQTASLPTGVQLELCNGNEYPASRKAATLPGTQR